MDNTLRPVFEDRAEQLSNPKEKKIVRSFLDTTLEDPDLQKGLDKAIKVIATHASDNYKKTRDVKPRNEERDKEIVRLRDEEDKSFGQIPRALKAKNPKWVRPDGGPLTRDTVEKAYKRYKEKHS